MTELTLAELLLQFESRRYAVACGNAVHLRFIALTECTALLFGTICQAKFDCYAWATICVKTWGLHATLVGKISFYKMCCCVVYDKFTQKCIVMR